MSKNISIEISAAIEELLAASPSRRGRRIQARPVPPGVPTIVVADVVRPRRRFGAWARELACGRLTVGRIAAAQLRLKPRDMLRLGLKLRAERVELRLQVGDSLRVLTARDPHRVRHNERSRGKLTVQRRRRPVALLHGGHRLLIDAVIRDASAGTPFEDPSPNTRETRHP
ncbi:MAG: hypothetical protein ABSG43_26195 [Solirubrobacteraceae bacterium]